MTREPFPKLVDHALLSAHRLVRGQHSGVGSVMQREA
jgi:hypothetical protein